MLELDLIVLAILFFFSAFFSSSETALISVDRVRIRQLVKKGNKNAKLVEGFQASPQKMLTAILICNNLVNIAASAIATSIALQVFGSYAIGIAVGIMTFLILVVGEITPKNLAVRDSESMSLMVILPIKWITWGLTPVIWFLGLFTKTITRLVGKPEEEAMTEQDIKTMVTMGAEAGAIHEREKQMIHRIFKFNDISVEDVMTPRSEIKAVPAKASLENVKEVLAEKPHSRLPVFKKDLDDIVGIFYVKDAWNYLAGGKSGVTVRQLARPVVFAHQTKKIDSLLAEFQETRSNMAIVVDDYGGVLGLVTLEDLLEEIVGEIVDEIEAPMIENVGPQSFEADGRAPLNMVNQMLKTKWKSDDFDTISGFMIEKLDRLPKRNEEVAVGNFVLKATDVRGPKILKIKITRKAPVKKV